MHRETVNNMPESSTETETEARGRDTQQRNERQASHNVVSVISKLVDDNLSIVRNISTGLAFAGLVILTRSIKLVTKFHTAHEIPSRFIEKNVSLRGKIHSITERGIEVEHVPIYLPIISPLLSKHKGVSRSPLLVHLAGVELTAEGQTWLQKNLSLDQSVWLKLISRENSTLHCLISQKRQGSAWSHNLNEELLRLGLARSAPIGGVPPSSPLYWRLHKRLHKAEVKAERKRRGLWSEESLWKRVSRVLSESTLFRLMRRILGRTRTE